jgi:hypothetical protein
LSKTFGESDGATRPDIVARDIQIGENGTAAKTPAYHSGTQVAEFIVVQVSATNQTRVRIPPTSGKNRETNNVTRSSGK